MEMDCGESWKGEFSTPHITDMFLCKLVGFKAEYSDTSANEDNSFRNHIR